MADRNRGFDYLDEVSMTDKQSKALWLADQLERMSLSTQWDKKAAAELRRLHEVNAELVEVAKKAEQALDILWVSHHANRTDHALELLRSALAKAEGK